MPSSSLRELLTEYGDMPVCGRCLVVLDATSQIRAKHRSGTLEVFDQVTNIHALKAWVLIKILERGW